MPLLKTILAAIRPQPEPTPPATLDLEPTPPGCVRLGGGLYRLPRSGGDAASAAAELRVMAECFGTPDEMRALGVPENVVQRHIPKEAPVAAPATSKKESTTVPITTQTYDRLQDHDAVPQPTAPTPAEAPKPGRSTGRSTSPLRARVGEIVHIFASTGDCVPGLVMRVLIPDRRPGREIEREHPRVNVLDLRSPGSPSKTVDWDPSPTAYENDTDVTGYPRPAKFHRIQDCPWGR